MFSWREKSKKRKAAATDAVLQPDYPLPHALEAGPSLTGAGSSSKIFHQLGAAPGPLHHHAPSNSSSTDAASIHVQVPPFDQRVKEQPDRAQRKGKSPFAKPSMHSLRRQSSLADIPDSSPHLPNSRQSSSAMSSDSLLHSPSHCDSSASSITGGVNEDTPPNSAPAHQATFTPDRPATSSLLRRSPSSSQRSFSGSTNSHSASKYQKHKPTHSPIPSVNSSSKTDESATPLSRTPNSFDHHHQTPPGAAGEETDSPTKSRAIPLEQSAEDATEEIVPWMFDGPDRRDQPDMQPFPSSASRQRRPSLTSGLPKLLRGTSSSSNLRVKAAAAAAASGGNGAASDDRESLYEGSVHDATPRQKKNSGTSKSLFSMLKRKPSRSDLATETDNQPQFSDPFRFRSPSMTSLNNAFASAKRPSSRKGTSKDKSSSKKSGASKGLSGDADTGYAGLTAQQAAAGATGFTLDTNMDEMEGIVSQDTLNSSTSNTGFLNDRAFHHRPSTPDSITAATLARRRGSLAPSYMTYSRDSSSRKDSEMGFDGESSAPSSPLREEPFRRPSLAVDGTSIWQPGFNFTTATNASQNQGIGIALEESRPPSGGPAPTRGSATRTSAGMQGAAAANAAARAAHAQQHHQQQQLAALQQSQAIDANLNPEAGWTAPESWAVEEMTQDGEDADASDEDGQALGASPISGGLSPMLLPGEERRESNGGRRTSLVPGRPGTSGSMGGASSLKGPNYALRIFKPDNTFTTLMIPISVPVSEVMYMVSRKPGFVNQSGRHLLYLREKGAERAMATNERPVRLQQLRFEQAGYSEWDKPEDLGREDHSYMVKFVYKPDVALRVGSDDFRPDTFEYIDLRDRGLVNIPIFLYNHAHDVVSLNLSRNPKPELPSDFVQLCTALRELRLAEIGMKRVPQSVRQAAGLTRLDISNNRILELEHVSLDQNAELMLIEAYNNRIFSLPAYFGHFKAIKYLDFSNNKFEEFPRILCEVATITDLDMSFNSLTTLPEEIGRLISLERLILTANSLVRFPSSFGQLGRLFELDVRHNALEDLTPLNELRKLTTLRASHNKVAAFDLSFDVLRTASLASNPATTCRISHAPVLARLDLSRCKLPDFENSESLASACPSLEDLVLDYNSFRKLPPNLHEMANLTKVSAINNKLEAIPDLIGDFNRLQHLVLPNNDLQEIPASIWNLGELVTLNLSSNLLTEFPDPPPLNPPVAAEEIEADRKMSTASKMSVTSKMSSTKLSATPLAASLQNLILADNRLSDETFHPASLMTELKVLNLSYNEIFEIPPKTLPKNSRLEELYLSGCKLTTLPEDDIERLINLRILHLNGNKLNTLPAELGVLKKLVALDAGSNVLKYNIANWKFDWNWNWNLELRYLNLSGNKRLEIKPAGPQAMHGGEDNTFAAAKRRNLSDFTALRKLRTLGLMDVTLTITNVPDDTEDRRVRTSLSEINNMGYGISDTLGSRDALQIIDLVAPKFRNSDDECLFGLFDSQLSVPQSQAGAPLQTDARLARYLQDCFSTTMHLEMGKMIEGEADISDVLRRTFLTINREYGNIVVPAYLDNKIRSDSGEKFGGASGSVRGGASGVVAYISGKTLYVANVGRAQGIIAGRSGLAKPLTTSHHPLNRDEWTRVRAAEGWVSSKGLVNDEVDVSRSFGHFHAFPAVNASPAISIIELTDQDELVILANRGFWDYVDFQSAVDIARAERTDTMMAAQKLRDLAIAYGSKAHIMVMVVSVADIFKAKLAPKRRGLAADADADNAYAAAKAAASRARGAGNGIVPTERYLSLMDREIAPPTGHVALVFTDIRNSTALWDSNSGMQVAIRMHNQLLRRQLRAIGGYEVKTEGDAFMCSFPSVTSALLWSFTCQLELLHQDWPQSILDCEDGVELYDGEGEDQQLIYRGLSVRMGIHWGQPHCETDPITRRMDYFGPMVNRSARVESVAEGGQITASADVVDIVKELCGFHSEDPSHSALLTDEDFEELDEVTKRDINAIRSMGVCITELGEKKLKGLETSEFISLLYPKALAGRLKYSTALPSTAHNMVTATQTLEPIPHLLDAIQIQALGTLLIRAEAAAAAQTHPPAPVTTTSPATAQMSPNLSRVKRKQSHHPHVADYPIALDSTDEELMAVLENLVIRLENLTNSLTLHQLGPYTEVLGALSQASHLDPRMILQGLSMFAGLMGHNTAGMPPFQS